jgi:MFS family permease
MVARAASTFGTGFGPVALAFGLLASPTGGPSVLSVVLACHVLPQVLFVLLAGAMADRLPKARLLAAAEGVASVAWAAMGGMVIAGRTPTVAMAGCAVAAGLAAAVLGPTLTAIVPELVPAERLNAANSTLKSATYAARLAGLAAAGPAVALVGPGPAILLDSGSYLVAAVVLFGLRSRRRAAPKAPGPLADLRAGWREFAGRQWVWVLVSTYSFVYALSAAVTGVLGPLAAATYLGGAAAWSLVLTAQTAGTVAGMLVARRLEPARPALAVALQIPAAAAPIALLALAAPLALVVVCAAATGITAGVVSVLAATTMQKNVPTAVLSRVSAYDWLGSLAMAPLALAVAGPAAQAFGTRTALAGCAVGVLLAGIAAMASPEVRALRAPSVAAANAVRMGAEFHRGADGASRHDPRGAADTSNCEVVH